MINSILVKNYKAFSEAKIDLKPITILLGANSSGKSSLMQFVLLLKQTICNNEAYDSALKLNGRFVNLGEDENLIKDRKHSSQLTLELEFNFQEYLLVFRNLIETLEKEIAKVKDLLHSIGELGESFDKMNVNLSISNLKETKYNDRKIYELLNYYVHTPIDKLDINDNLWITNKDFYSKILKSRFLYSNLSVGDKDVGNTLTILEDALELLKPFKDLEFGTGIIGYILVYNSATKKIDIEDHYVTINNKILIRYNKEKISSEVLSNAIINKYINTIAKFSYSSLKLDENIGNDERNWITHTILSLFNEAYKEIDKSFSLDNVNYVGPLRAYPQRYYFLDEANINISLNTKSGVSLAEILKKDGDVNLKINKWLKKFGLKVTVKEFKDIIHNIKISQNGLDLDIIDVGFGISQVLPILVQGFMSKTNSLTLIEQPEIHLHPKMQAELADLFIDIISEAANKKRKIKKRLLIETHSEYILKRLRRRISEGKLSSKDVAIYFIEPRGIANPDTAIVKEIKISRNGSFEWPKDFYETELEDDMIFFKNMAAKKSTKSSKDE